MKSKTFFSLPFLLFCLGSLAQEYRAMVKTRKEGWTYIDLKGNLLKIEKTFKCSPYSEGFAAQRIVGELYYFIDANGKRLKSDYDKIRLKLPVDVPSHTDLGITSSTIDPISFCNGLVPLKIDGNWGYMDTTGKVVIPPKYDDVWGFSEGFAIVKKKHSWLIIDTHANELALDSTNIKDIKHFQEGFAPVLFRSESGKFWGFIDTTGEVSIQAKFSAVGYFSEGLAWAREGQKLVSDTGYTKDDNEDGSIGYINTKGEWVVKPQFERAYEFDIESGMARVKTVSGWAYVNKNGALMFKKDTDYYGDFSNGLAMGKQKKQIGFFDKNGKWVIEPKFDAARDFHNGYAAVEFDDKWGLIDKQGNWILQPHYESLQDMERVK